MPSKLQSSDATFENSSPAVATNSTEHDLSHQVTVKRQTSVFAKLPAELLLHIFSYLDVVAVFRFMDTCHFHRQLLLGLPEAWHRVRFVPISEYTANFSKHGSTTTSISGSSVARFHRSYQASGASSPNPSSSHSSPRVGVEFRKESKRDEERGGTQSPISEVYAVLRRFREENGLLPHVREIYMDSIDMHHFPSPLVMLFKFPNLRVLSSRHRRKQTSLATDVHLLKDMLRNGHVLPHSMKLERWDIWHPYLAEDDVLGFQKALDAICRVGLPALDGEEADNRLDLESSDEDGHVRSNTLHTKQGRKQRSKCSGVQLDIALCPGPDPKQSTAVGSANGTLSVEIEDLQAIVHGHTQPHNAAVVHGGGIHWTPTGTPTLEQQQQHQQQQEQQQQHQQQQEQPSPQEQHPSHPQQSSQVSTEPLAAPQPQNQTFTINYGYPTPETNLGPTRPPCSRVIWKEETCLDCGQLQKRCWLCSKHCPGCGATRSPPHVRHQRNLNMQMLRRDMMRKQLELKRQQDKIKREGGMKNCNNPLGIIIGDDSSGEATTKTMATERRSLQHPEMAHPMPVTRTPIKGSSATNLDPQLSLPEFALFD